MKVALGQINSTTGDIAGNSRKIIQFIEQARSSGADLVVFPEMAITGYCVSDLMEDRSFVAANMDAVWRVAQACTDITAVVGFIEYDPMRQNEDGSVRKYNSAAVLRHGRVAGVARKSLLPNYRYFDDKRYFSAGSEQNPIQVEIAGRNRTLGVAVCEDIWDSNYAIKPVRELASQGSEIIVVVNASPFHGGKLGARMKEARRHVWSTRLPLVYVNAVGAMDNGKNIIPFDGRSFALDGQGRTVAHCASYEEDLQIVDIDARDLPESPVPVDPWEKDMYDALVVSIADYARKTGFTRAVIPLSGGIDSALGICLTVDALGKDNVVAFNLPSRFNTEMTRNIAHSIASNLGVEYRVIPIGDIDSRIKEVYQEVMGPIKDRVAGENIHARIRGLLMMLYSNDQRALLISNGNETEIALGYSTLYGDMCGGISVIGDLSKMDVYRLCRYVNQRHGREILPQDVFTIKPSAELSDGQYDPFDYPVVAPLVSELAERRTCPEHLVDKFRDRSLPTDKFGPDAEGKSIYEKFDLDSFSELVFRCHRLMTQSVYKRLQGPPIIVVSERAFGFDLRESIINKWTGRSERW